jgi:bifunctional non-homologous end joining protein LigD
MSLTTYQRKRDFKSSPEPAARKAKGKGLSFVVQRHDASHLHYDFRLQVDGVLKSWAIPKGPSMNPADKRLAVMVEDHPLAYGKFEGEIPEGNYGAGTVEIWDNGTYEPEEVKATSAEKEMQSGLRKGSLKFVMHGKKLKGSFALVQLKNDSSGKNWLLIKHKDEYADAEFSVEHNRKSKSSKVKVVLKKKTPANNEEVKYVRSVRSGADKLKKFITPMLAQSTDKPFVGDDWIYEIKWDGYRAVAEVEKREVKLYSRNGLSFLNLYPAVAQELAKLKQDMILDGEVVVLDENGKPSFQKLQHYGDNRSQPLKYYVFDCLSYKGKNLKDLPLLERKKILARALPRNNDIILYSDHVAKEGLDFFAHAVHLGLEGIIAKRADSTYVPGKRTGDWLKIKNHNTQEAIIAGYTQPRGSRVHFGALVLGMYKNKKLVYTGHTGTGFTDKILKDVYEKLQPLVRKDSSFQTKVPINAPVTWVEPVQVCEIKFTEMTDEGIFRHPVFMGLRVDKSAKEVNHLDKVVDNKTKTKSMKATARKTATKSKVKAKSGEKRKSAEPSEEPEDTGSNNKKLKVDGHIVALTNQDKIYFPDLKITKGDVVEYYNSVAKYILPYLKDRPQSLKRNPNGITDRGFFHKDAGDSAPSWVKSIELYSESADKDIDYILCNNKATLMYLNNLGCIEINPWNSRVKKLDSPDYLIIDIDPSDRNSFHDVVDAALATREVLDRAGAASYCKTSGASGLHVYVPLGAKYSYDQARSFAEIVATLTQEILPDTTTLERPLNKRKGRIYLDYLQNKRGQTLASVYSLRPVEVASVSTPLLWKEVKHGLSPGQFTLKTLPKRLQQKGDLFGDVLGKGIDMNKCLKKLG